jgi:hypothetical protein
MYICENKHLLVRDCDGYINATALCKAGGKLFNSYHQNNQTKAYVQALERATGIPVLKIIESKKGKNGGTWVHPQVATHLAQWISPEFAVQVTTWISEWRLLSQKNDLEYIRSLQDIKPGDKKYGVEKEIQDRLHKQLGGEIEVCTEFGYIDLLTTNELIEIKESSNWKHGVGQLLAYGVFYKNHRLRLHLFGTDYVSNSIYDFCRTYNITVTIE